MVIPLRSGRQNPLLGLGECRRHGRHPPVLRRDPRAVPPQPRFGIEPAGQDPGQAVTPGRRHYRSVRSRMPVLSATIFDAVFVRAGFGTCPLALITVWLPVRVLPAPPRSPALTVGLAGSWSGGPRAGERLGLSGGFWRMSCICYLCGALGWRPSVGGSSQECERLVSRTLWRHSRAARSGGQRQRNGICDAEQARATRLKARAVLSASAWAPRRES